MTTTIRASRLPLALACSASLDADPLEVPVGPSGPMADLGTAYHIWMAALVEGRTPPDPVDLAVEYAVPSEDLERLCAQARRLWTMPLADGSPSLRQIFAGKEGGTEVPMAAGALTGTADLIAYQPDPPSTVFVLDYKSGWADWDYSEQIRGYGWLSLAGTDAEQAWLGVLNVRRGILDARIYTRPQLDAWYARAQHRLADKTYRAGAHCMRCPRAATCPAVTAWSQQAMASIVSTPIEQELTSDVFAGRAASFLGAAKFLEKVIERGKEAVKAILAQHPDGLPLPDGGRIALASQDREEIDAPAALPILRSEGCPVSGNIENHLSLTKAGLERAIAEVAPKGKKAPMLRQTLDALREAGAISKKTVQQIEVTREQ